jgi:hypothetical protein
MKSTPFRSALAALCLAALTAGAADVLWSNTGNMFLNEGEAPQIDAISFYNSGVIDMLSTIPFDTQNTLNFTNRGTLRGSVGFQFDLASSTAPRRPAANFVNQRGGTIEAFEYLGLIASNTIYYPTYVLVSATNIVNEGTLIVGNSGLLRLEGKTINCTRGAFEVGSLEPSFGAGSNDDLNMNYIQDSGIYDVYWGTGIMPDQGAFPGQNTAAMLRAFGADFQMATPLHLVTYPPSRMNTAYRSTYVNFNAYPIQAFCHTNVIGGLRITLTNANGTITNVFAPTNIMRQAVLVSLNDTNNFTVNARFYPSQRAGVEFNTAAVELRLLNTNAVAGVGETNSLFIVDRLAAETNLVVYTNASASIPRTCRPQAYEMMRTAPPEYDYGFNGNALIDKNFIYNTGLSNRFVTNYYAGYRASLDFLTVRPPVVADMGPTDQPGRIEIVGDSVDLTRARFRGMGLISVKAKHLVSSSNALVDCSSLLYNLASTNGLLTLQNLATPTTLRLGGTISLWSGLWTNQMALVLSNWYIDANTNYFNPVTNAIDVGMHVFMVGADTLSGTQQVIVHDLIARATNIVLNDHVAVVRSLILEGESFTLNGALVCTNGAYNAQGIPIENLPNFGTTNVPGIRAFTNNGTLSVPNIANYGYEGDRSLGKFVNRGVLNAFDTRIAADVYEEAGFVNSSNSVTVFTAAGKFEGGRHLCIGNVSVRAGDLKLRSYSADTDSGYYLNVTNNLSDAGINGRSTIRVQDGFHLLRKPATGDLLGTTFQSTAPMYASVPHTWAAEDRGATVAGYLNNAAIGQLVLEARTGAEFRFQPPQDELGNYLPGQYALYVDVLNLSATILGDLESYLAIAPNFTLYFANANVVPSTLDGRLNGRLRWVKDYAGPTSGTPVASYQGGGVWKTIYVNTSLLNSDQIDSDADGLVNAYDTAPFNGVSLKDALILGPGPAQVQFSWEAAAQTVYRVESSPSLTLPAWTALQTITNAALNIRTLTVTDTLPAPAGSVGERYYRVRYDP